MLCPRQCKVNRIQKNTGLCGVTDKLKLARAALHFWEEGCISGTKGSGAVFFSGCNLRCVYCQNKAIAQGTFGKEIEKERLTEIFLELQEQGANNINLVTAGHYLPQIIWAVEQSRNQGLNIPIVYNTGSYEKPEAIQALEGIVDVYLPDFKYFSPELALKYSKAEDYPKVAKAAIKEMVRQQPKAIFEPEQGTVTEEGETIEIMKKGVIVRHLLLPGQLRDAKAVVKYLYENYGNQIYLSLMSQFTPLPHVAAYPELNRRVSPKSYEKLIDYALGLGVEQGFIQEGEVAEESFIPDFDITGV